MLAPKANRAICDAFARDAPPPLSFLPKRRRRPRPRILHFIVTSPVRVPLRYLTTSLKIALALKNKKKTHITMSYNAGCADSSAVRITPFLVMLTISFPVQSVQHPPYCCASDAKSPLRPPRDFRTLGRLSHSPRLSPRGRRRRREFSEVPAKIRPVAPRRRQLRQDDATHELLSPSPPRQRPPFPRSFSRACDLRHFRRSSLSPCLTPTLHHREPPLRITGASETHSRERPGDELFKLARKSDRRVTWRRRVAYRVTCLWGALGD